MSETYADAPETWLEVEPRYDFQVHAWRNTESDNVLVIEAREEQWHSEDEGPDHQLVLLGPDPEADPEPIRTIVEQDKNVDAVVERAYEYMMGHP